MNQILNLTAGAVTSREEQSRISIPQSTADMGYANTHSKVEDPLRDKDNESSKGVVEDEDISCRDIKGKDHANNWDFDEDDNDDNNNNEADEISVVKSSDFDAETEDEMDNAEEEVDDTPEQQHSIGEDET
jgi:hypothetical protein